VSKPLPAETNPPKTANRWPKLKAAHLPKREVDEKVMRRYPLTLTSIKRFMALQLNSNLSKNGGLFPFC
jgi:hypothetical protein